MGIWVAQMRWCRICCAPQAQDHDCAPLSGDPCLILLSGLLCSLLPCLLVEVCNPASWRLALNRASCDTAISNSRRRIQSTSPTFGIPAYRIYSKRLQTVMATEMGFDQPRFWNASCSLNFRGGASVQTSTPVEAGGNQVAFWCMFFLHCICTVVAAQNKIGNRHLQISELWNPIFQKCSHNTKRRLSLLAKEPRQGHKHIM